MGHPGRSVVLRGGGRAQAVDCFLPETGKRGNDGGRTLSCALHLAPRLDRLRVAVVVLDAAVDGVSLFAVGARIEGDRRCTGDRFQDKGTGECQV